MSERSQAYTVLTMNTLAFTVCFAVWMMNGVLITFLVTQGTYAFTEAEMGFLIGTPVLTGSILRLPAGILTDTYGGRRVFAVLMLLTAAACFFVSFADSFWSFIVGGLGFGLAGASFAVGIAYTSVWFPKQQQGTALGIFGAGNAGAAITSLAAPSILIALTANSPEGWRGLPRIYGVALIIMTIAFWFLTHERRADQGHERSLRERLQPLKEVRVWRFGLYYFLVFGGFVALAQWLIPYYVNVYTVSVATAGLLASIFTLPSGIIRALGGWLSDKLGARTVMYWVLGGCAIFSLLLIFPRMDISAPGSGILAKKPGQVESISDSEIVVSGKTYALVQEPERLDYNTSSENLILPTFDTWHVVNPELEVGDEVSKNQLLAKGNTHIFFQANIWIFTVFVFFIGILMGIGKAAVYKHIPTYFPNDVGVVGGIVGVLGGLGGFVCPLLFGSLLGTTGVWTTCWMFFLALSLWCLIWMHGVIKRMMAERAPEVAQAIDAPHVEERPRLRSSTANERVHQEGSA